ncbi:sensor histidine kinase [Dyella acidisoli]|uniref:sensor histidine kinase n=1 Tax=Dyella acidisoli TaxID=1867834 RepID=UPI0024E19670|nr:ATP-binding protein [Dyella acidisoli]
MFFVLLLACGLFASSVAAEQIPSTTNATIELQSAEAAPADWHSEAPPVDGWTPVKLMDLWDTRWPHHDGVVWYRLHWNQTSTDQPVGLFIDYVSLAYVLYVNGNRIYSDTHLVEPLSRTWIRPQYFLIDKPLLRQGQNTLLVRVSGLAGYQPGFGAVTIGNPDAVQARERRGEFLRYNVQVFDLSVSFVFGGLFFLLWLLRRKDTYYGWYALCTVVWSLYTINFLASSPWPFNNTPAWEAINAAAYFASTVTFAIFLLRYAGYQWPRTEGIMLVLCVALFAVALLCPQWTGHYRAVAIIFGCSIYYVAIFGFMGYAWRHPRADNYALAGSLLIPLVVSAHDMLLFLGVIRSDSYLLAVTSPITIIGMGSALAYRFAVAMRRAENFNLELQREVQAATGQLTETLKREHDLALNNARIGERLNLVRDLHDGFGGSLLAAISTLENPRLPPEPAQVVITLKELRDDLRLIIDTTTHERDTDLAGLLAPLRHRWSQRFEAIAIDNRWTVEGVDDLSLGAMRVLELLRFLQESLTNVLKHSSASQVHVYIRRKGECLNVEVRDDGQGFDLASVARRGAGLPSLRARVGRLGATLQIMSSPGGGTRLSFDVPLSPMALT